MKILLSIKPQFADKIFNGTKGFEFRKSLFKDPRVKTVVVYVTRPVCKIVGEFDIASVERGSPTEVWLETSHQAGISKSFYDEYFEGRTYAYALRIGEVRKYQNALEPDDLIPNFTAPQSYMYLDARRQNPEGCGQSRLPFAI